MSEYSHRTQALSIGQKVERIRTFKGLKQEYMAAKLGISQSQFSKIEKLEVIEEPLLNAISELLRVSSDEIEHFNDELVTYNINNCSQFYDAGQEATGKDETESANLYKQIIELYERLIASEQEKCDLLKYLIN